MLGTSALGYPVSVHHPAGQHFTVAPVAVPPGGQPLPPSHHHPSVSPSSSSCSAVEYPSTGEGTVMISPGMGEMTNVSLANGTVVDSTGAIMVASPLTCHQQVSPDQAQMGEYGAPPVHNSHSPQLSNGSKATVNGHQANGSNGNQSASHQPGNIHSTAEYLQQLLKDRARLGAFPGTFIHAERLLDAEIAQIRASLFQINNDEKKPLMLPEPEGAVIMRTEKVYVPVEEHPEFNFVGRILGPRGMTAKQLEQETGCKIMVRGRGSMRDKKKEESNRGKANWEHLNDKLHVLITVEDTDNRAQLKLNRAIEEVKKLLVPITEGEDELKKRQLMELAIINGTYRDAAARNSPVQQQCLALGIDPEQLKSLTSVMSPMAAMAHHQQMAVRHQQQLGAPLILGPRQYAQQATTSHLLNGNAAASLAASMAAASAPPLIATSSDGSTLLYTTHAANPYAPEFHPAAHHHHHHQYATLGHSQLIDFSAAAAAAAAAAGTPVLDATSGAASKDKRSRASRYHPYDSLLLQRTTGR